MNNDKEESVLITIISILLLPISFSLFKHVPCIPSIYYVLNRRKVAFLAY